MTLSNGLFNIQKLRGVIKYTKKKKTFMICAHKNVNAISKEVYAILSAKIMVSVSNKCVDHVSFCSSAK